MIEKPKINMKNQLKFKLPQTDKHMVVIHRFQHLMLMPKFCTI